MHSFDPKIAEMVGLAPAVIYQNIVWWIAKNEANGENLIDGHYWTYNSVKAFAVLFPYLTEDQVRRALEKLVDCGLIVVGNHNKSAYDRTKWFRLSCQMDLANLPNGNGGNAEPIPDIKPDVKPLKKEDTYVSSKEKRGSRIDPDWQPTEQDIQHAFKKGLSHDEARQQAERFRDFWLSKAGAGGVKLDWAATWRTWIGNYLDRRPSQGRGQRPATNGQEPVSRADIAIRRIKEAEGLRDGW